MPKEARLNFEFRPIDLVILENTCSIQKSEARYRNRSTSTNDVNDGVIPFYSPKRILRRKFLDVADERLQAVSRGLERERELRDLRKVKRG
jgi:hypothetical protein